MSTVEMEDGLNSCTRKSVRSAYGERSMIESIYRKDQF